MAIKNLAPLASQETLDTAGKKKSFLIDEPWRQEGFHDLPRSQQTVKIFEVVDNLMRTMKEGVRSSQRQVDGLRRRMERLETLVELLDEAPELEAIPSQTGSGKEAGEAEDGGDWFYSLENYETDGHPHSATILQHRRANPKITLNVGGHRHEVMWKQLEKKPLTRLGKLSRAKTHREILGLTDGYSLSANEIYFDRDPASFNGILNFYRTNRLHLLDEICVLDYQDDLEFWMIRELNLEICCIDKFTARRDAIVEEIAKEKAFAANDDDVEEFEKGYFTKYQRCLWELFEQPQSSVPAKVLSLISITLVLISLVAMCLNTFTWLQSQDVNGNPVDNPKLALIEFLLRLAGAPKKIAFLKNTMNIVDCAAILPYYITLFFMPADDFGSIPDGLSTTASPLSQALPTNTTVSPDQGEEDGGFGNFSRIMQVFRIARIMRIFKLARRSVGLQAMAHTVRTSWKDLGLLFMLVGMGMLVFGSLLYYIEYDDDTTGGFVSIPAGMWWAVQTLTSLGYGDYWPESVLGKIMGSACAVCGVLVMALPIPIVVDNFANYYSEQKRLESQELKREEFTKEMDFRAEMRETEEKELLKTVARNMADIENNKPKQTQISFG